MRKIAARTALLCTVAAMFSMVPYSMQASRTNGLTLSSDEAQAVVGRPGTPVSYAGVARRTTRRAVRRGY
jgi:hypothetical protein